MDTGLRNAIPKQALQRDSKRPSRLEWIIAVFILIIQQMAFTMIPVVLKQDPEAAFLTNEYLTAPRGKKSAEELDLDPLTSPLNTICLLISMLLIPIVSIPRMRRFVAIVVNNPFAFIFLALVLASTLWSLHPDVTIKRGMSYALTISVAVYLVVAFTIDDCIKMLIHSFAITAIGSIVFVSFFPSQGIMWAESLEGNWRGVFIHKNGLGALMATGLFSQLYLFAARTGRISWGIFWAIVFFGLVLLSRSGTALVMCLLYLSMFFFYVVWLRHKMLGYSVAILFSFILIALGIALVIDPASVLGLLGKDATLTGRTDIWAASADLIDLRPLLGNGYRAMFIAGDPTTNWFWGRIGFEITHAHNSGLEIVLELGFIGLFLLIVFLGTALWRGLRCCLTGVLPLGYFTLIFFIGDLIQGATESDMGGGQDIGWVVSNMLAFACGQSLSSQQNQRPTRYAP